MASFDTLRHVSLGQYLPTGSLVHRLDPRAKLASMLLLVGAVVASSNYLPNLFLLVLILALEAQYPHRGAALGILIAGKLGLIDMHGQLNEATSQPASP